MIGKLIAKGIFKISGWKTSGSIPPEVNQCIAIGAPHTSNWDFIFTVCALTIFDYPAKILIKDLFFKNPLIGWFFRATGGIPVDRSKKNNLTGELKKMIESGKPIYILFSPEGTRKRVQKWKSGFYHVALDCNLPIAMGFLDYPNKRAGFKHLFYPTGNKQVDFEAMAKFYTPDMAANPLLYNDKFYLKD